MAGSMLRESPTNRRDSSIYLDGLAMRVGAVDLASIVGGDGSAWVGFTAATGGGHENHDILSWKFHGGPSTSATSTMSVVDSTISYKPFACLPNRTLCTPEQAVVEDKGPGLYHRSEERRVGKQCR